MVRAAASGVGSSSCCGSWLFLLSEPLCLFLGCVKTPCNPPYQIVSPQEGFQEQKERFANRPFRGMLCSSTTKDENVIPAPEPESRVRSAASACGGLDSRSRIKVRDKLRGNDKAGIFGERSQSLSCTCSWPLLSPRPGRHAGPPPPGCRPPSWLPAPQAGSRRGRNGPSSPP